MIILYLKLLLLIIVVTVIAGALVSFFYKSDNKNKQNRHVIGEPHTEDRDYNDRSYEDC